MNKLTDWLARFENELDQVLKEAKDFHTKDRISEAKLYVERLDELRVQVDKLITEVF